MKKILILFVLFIFFSCNNDEYDVTWGYACINSQCVQAVNGPYEDMGSCIDFCSSTQNKD